MRLHIPVATSAGIPRTALIRRLLEGLGLDRQIPGKIVAAAGEEEHHEPAAHMIQHVLHPRAMSAIQGRMKASSLLSGIPRLCREPTLPRVGGRRRRWPGAWLDARPLDLISMHLI